MSLHFAIPVENHLKKKSSNLAFFFSLVRPRPILLWYRKILWKRIGVTARALHRDEHGKTRGAIFLRWRLTAKNQDPMAHAEESLQRREATLRQKKVSQAFTYQTILSLTRFTVLKLSELFKKNDKVLLYFELLMLVEGFLSLLFVLYFVIMPQIGAIFDFFCYSFLFSWMLFVWWSYPRMDIKLGKSKLSWTKVDFLQGSKTVRKTIPNGTRYVFFALLLMVGWRSCDDGT